MKNSMKSYIQLNYPEVELEKQLPESLLKNIITKYRDSITPEELSLIIASVPVKCRIVIESGGSPTNY